MLTYQPLNFTMCWDEDIELKTRIVKWSSVALNVWMDKNKKNKRACDFIKNCNIEVCLKKSKNFWGSVTKIEYNREKYYDVLSEYDPQMTKLDDLAFYFIISHEMGHCIDYAIRGDSWHDTDWKTICKDIGAQPSSFIEVKKLLKIEKEFPEYYNTAIKIVKDWA